MSEEFSNEPRSWSPQGPLGGSRGRCSHIMQPVFTLYWCVITVNWKVRIPSGSSVLILLNEWRKEAQKGKWECLRVHRKLRWDPRQHLVGMIPTLVPLPHQSDVILSNLFHVSLQRFVQSKYSIHMMPSNKSSVQVQNQVCSSELLDLQTSSSLGPSVEGLHCLWGSWVRLLEISTSPLQQPVFQRDPQNQVFSSLPHLHATPGTLAPNLPLTIALNCKARGLFNSAGPPF